MNVDQPTPGSTVDDISAQVNILVQNAKDGGSPTDPLNVIPDEYEYEEDFGIEEFDQEKIQLKYSSNNLWLTLLCSVLFDGTLNIFCIR